MIKILHLLKNTQIYQILREMNTSIITLVITQKEKKIKEMENLISIGEMKKEVMNLKKVLDNLKELWIKLNK